MANDSMSPLNLLLLLGAGYVGYRLLSGNTAQQYTPVQPNYTPVNGPVQNPLGQVLGALGLGGQTAQQYGVNSGALYTQYTQPQINTVPMDGGTYIPGGPTVQVDPNARAGANAQYVGAPPVATNDTISASLFTWDGPYGPIAPWANGGFSSYRLGDGAAIPPVGTVVSVSNPGDWARGATQHGAFAFPVSAGIGKYNWTWGIQSGSTHSVWEVTVAGMYADPFTPGITARRTS